MKVVLVLNEQNSNYLFIYFYSWPIRYMHISLSHLTYMIARHFHLISRAHTWEVPCICCLWTKRVSKIIFFFFWKENDKYYHGWTLAKDEQKAWYKNSFYFFHTLSHNLSVVCYSPLLRFLIFHCSSTIQLYFAVYAAEDVVKAEVLRTQIIRFSWRLLVIRMV